MRQCATLRAGELESTAQVASLRLVDTPELLSQIRATSGKLLRGYVELCGRRLAQMVRKSVETPDWLKARGRLGGRLTTDERPPPCAPCALHRDTLSKLLLPHGLRLVL